MPFRIKLKKSKHYSVVSKSLCVIAVRLLENATVECIVSSRTVGRECLQNVCQRLQITQPEYFGLRYQTRDGQQRWVDLERPLKKQLDKHGACASARDGCSLQLGVMFYVPDAQARRLLHSDVTRYYYFSQLKSDVIEGKLPCERREAIQLASYSLQAEFGNHRPEHHTAEYLRNFALLPKSVLLACENEEEEAALLDEIVQAHRSLQGLDHATAELYYIQTVQRLEGYGEERFEVRDAAGADMVLGVSVLGVTARHVRRPTESESSQPALQTPVEEQQQQLMVYRWSEIVDLIHHKRCFKIVGRDSAHSAQFHLEDVSTAKYIWKMCVQQHGFFMSMHDAVAVPGGVSGGDTYTRAVSGSGFGAGETFHWSSAPDAEGGGKGRANDVGESRESLDELGVYHTETRNSENYTFPGSTGDLVDPNHNGYDHHLTGCPQPVSDSVVASREHIPVLNEVSRQVNSVHQSYVSLPRSSESATDLRRALLPSYRQAPDYETAVLTKYGVTSCSLNDLPLETGQSSQVYHQQPAMAPSAATNELDISLPRSCNPLLPPLSYMHYGNFADLTELGDSMSFGDLANNNSRIDGVTHGRAPPLLAPPLHTYSTPELTSQGLSYEVNPAQLFANMHLNYQYKPPPPYPYAQRPSASTPDLTRNHHQLRASASPDLVSRRHLSQSTIQGSEPNLPHYQAAVNGSMMSESLRSIVEPPRPVLPTYVPVGESWNAQVSGVAQPQRIQVYVSSPTTREQVAPAVKPVDVTPMVPPRKQVTEEKREPSSDKASLAHPLGPMMVAAMNGLTLTVAQSDQLTTSDQGSVGPEAPSTSRSKELRPEQVLENRLEDGQVFLEFERITKRKPNADFTTALLSENTSRNRFSDVLPYEENRVRLTPTPDNRTGYINASHVSASVSDSQRFYIAAQGPMRETAKSFWQMIWENHVGVVVMLTETEDEHGHEKCFQYWPTADGDDAALSFGEYRVTRKGAVSSAVAVTTSLVLSRSQGVTCSHRNVWHLRYTDWPDHGTPGDIQGFLGFMEEVDSVRRLAFGDQRLLRTRNSPMVVHCTAGVGRSGVVILCDILLFCLDHNVPVDVPHVLSSVRMQRMLSVQTLAQYKFVYQVLIRYLRNSRLI